MAELKQQYTLVETPKLRYVSKRATPRYRQSVKKSFNSKRTSYDKNESIEFQKEKINLKVDTMTLPIYERDPYT